MASEAEIAAMRHAVLLSALGLGTTSPNPPVGCVILDAEGKVAGTGYHRRKGEAHAEVHALRAASTAAYGGTAVVTLEPCNHVGVTPACRQALLDAGIARVIVGVMDPTSRGEGGAAALAAAGVEVESGVMSDEVLQVLGPWLTATKRRTPHLTLAYALGDYGDASSEAPLLSALRSEVDIVVSGGQIEEGRSAGHSARHFHLEDLQPPGRRLETWLRDAYQAGVRTALLFGWDRAADLALSTGAVDRLVLALPRKSGQFVDIGSRKTAPQSYDFVSVSSYPDGLLVHFQKQL